MDSEPCSGRPSKSWNDNIIEQVQTAIMQDHRIRVREIWTELGVTIGLVHSILSKDLHMRRVSTKFVPKLLRMEQKQSRLDIAQDMLYNANTLWTPWSQTMRHGFMCTTQKRRCSHHCGNIRHLRGQKTHGKSAAMSRSCWVFFDSHWVHHEYAPHGQTITKEYYQEILLCLRNAVRRKRLDLSAAKSWQLHHDKAPAM